MKGRRMMMVGIGVAKTALDAECAAAALVPAGSFPFR